MGILDFARIPGIRKEIAEGERRYKELLREVNSAHIDLEKNLASLGRTATLVATELQKADAILRPLVLSRSRAHAQFISLKIAAIPISRLESTLHEFHAVEAGAKALGAGASIAVGSWVAVSFLGSASTGMAISGLSGAAATSATLAWFGAGSLATGGAGIMGGVFVLSGLALIPAAVIGALLGNKRAQELKERLTELNGVNRENRQLWQELKRKAALVHQAKNQIQQGGERLRDETALANRKLFRFGVLSKLFRWVRLKVRGSYYSHNDMPALERLGAEVELFLNQFSNQTKSLETTLGQI